jgi:hypothetical protein
MKRNVVILFVIILGIFGLWAVLKAQERPTDVPRSATLQQFMARKLDLSHGLLGALVSGDLPSAAEEAERVSMLCLDEDWNIVKTPEYVERSADFRRTANAIAKGAHEKNLAAAQLAYVQLVGQCFSCHEYVRDARKKK